VTQQPERQETVKRILRVFAVLSATAMVSALAVSGASASTVKPAVTAQPNTTEQSGSNCLFGEGGVPCYLKNQEGLYAAGDTHGQLVGTDASNGTRYVFTPVGTAGGETYGYISNLAYTLCWNVNPNANPQLYEIGLDSCPVPDYNELFAMVPCSGGSWCINSYDYGGSAKLWGYPNDSPLYFETGYSGPAIWWDALTSG
jgi:hypothetical protein